MTKAEKANMAPPKVAEPRAATVMRERVSVVMARFQREKLR